MSEPVRETEGSGSLVGQSIADRYLVVEKLGEGGMGTVYVAEQTALRKPVALKVIHPSIAGDGDIRERFEREAMASSKLEGHPHVASATDLGELPDGSLYLVMQLVRGTSLEKRIQEGPMPWLRAAGIAAQVADALAAAHALGIIHRDLKPDNVMMVAREDGTELAKVLDFGLARISENAPTTGKTVVGTSKSQPSEKLTRMGTIMGTPGYMSPEQAIGNVVDERTDLYALGVILWEMLVGRTLFEGDDFQTIVARQFGSAVDAPSRAGDPSIPEALDRLVLSLVASVAANRPARAIEVRDALNELVLQGSRGELLRAGANVARDSLATDRTMMAHASSLPAGTLPPGFGAAPSLPGTTPLDRAPHAPGPLRRFLGTPQGKKSAAALVIAGFVVALGSVFAISSGAHESAVGGSSILAPLGPRLSPELSAAVATISSSTDRRAREAAATQLLAAPASEPVPAFAKALAELDRARGCRAKKEIVVRLGEIGDNDALPYLGRLRDTPKNGCGFLGTRDCLSCLRGELDTAVQKLGGATN